MITRNNFSKKFIFSLRYFLLENIKIALSNKETNKQPKYIFFIFIEESKQQQKRTFSNEKIETNNVNIPKNSKVDLNICKLKDILERTNPE